MKRRTKWAHIPSFMGQVTGKKHTSACGALEKDRTLIPFWIGNDNDTGGVSRPESFSSPASRGFGFYVHRHYGIPLLQAEIHVTVFLHHVAA